MLRNLYCVVDFNGALVGTVSAKDMQWIRLVQSLSSLPLQLVNKSTRPGLRKRTSDDLALGLT
jgi:hypothetical protein